MSDQTSSLSGRFAPQVQPAGSAAFAAAAPRGVVESRCFESLWHELFNEQDAAPVFAALRQWLDARFPLKTIQK